MERDQRGTSLEAIHKIGRNWNLDQQQWEAEQAAAGAVPAVIVVTVEWLKECRQAYSCRCPACGEFGGSKEYQYTRADGKLWLCQACFDLIFGPTDGPQQDAAAEADDDRRRTKPYPGDRL